MTRDELVKFLEDNYEADEQLVWQTVSFDDVDVENSTLEDWKEFIEHLNTHNPIAEMFSWLTASTFHDWLYNPEEQEEEEE
jgi:hypothetical protein